MSNLVELIITAISVSGKPLTIQEIVNYINNLNFGRVYDYHSVYGAIYKEWEKDHYMIYTDYSTKPLKYSFDINYIAQNGKPIVGP